MSSYHFDDLSQNIRKLADNALEDAKIVMRNRELAADYYGENRYNRLIKEVRKARVQLLEVIKEVEFLKKHDHEWDSRDFCVYCGLDGRA